MLAAQMMRRHNPIVREAQGSLPNNHGALLRFRSKAVPEVTGIRFREVDVLKAVKDPYTDHLLTTSTLAHANEYSYKVTGAVALRSVIHLEPVTRYVAPPDFCAALGAGVEVRFNEPLTAHAISGHRTDFTMGEGGPILSTIPMPTLMALVGWDRVPRFHYRTIWSINVQLDGMGIDTFQTIYYPSLNTPYYRASLTGARLTLEYSNEPRSVDRDILKVCADFGFPTHLVSTSEPPQLSEQKYGKILPIDEQERRRFIVAMTQQYNLFSVGRFATWRQILLDDVVKDVKMIERFITDRSGYDVRGMFQ